jgi:hypothetical protein
MLYDDNDFQSGAELQSGKKVKARLLFLSLALAQEKSNLLLSCERVKI